VRVASRVTKDPRERAEARSLEDTTHVPAPLARSGAAADSRYDMARCATCGNEYDKAFTVVTAAGDHHTFDSFECAIHALAPQCGHCGVRVVGHGVESHDAIFCSAHCAERKGVHEAKDRV
jgi:hypothetical protein